MTALIIWSTAAIVYAIFLLWYVGFSRKITSAEVEATVKLFQEHGSVSEKKINDIRHLFENDDGKDFVMENLLELKEPRSESRKKLAQYQKIFLGNLLKRAGHPIFIANAASGNIENLGCSSDNWTAAGMIRYRSRRDLMEVLPATIGSEHHALKLDSLERTFAYPGAPWTIMGGPKLVVPLVLALMACLAHLAIL